MGVLDFAGDELQRLDELELRRHQRTVSGSGRFARVEGLELLNFASNDYLGLAGHSHIRLAAAEDPGESFGSSGSRLIAGTRTQHRALEVAMATFHGYESAILFNSGYQANVGVLGAIAEDGDLIVSDRLNHASVIDGCRLSRARVAVVAHGEIEAFSQALETRARRRFLVTDALFSMDGDVAPLVELRRVADRHRAALVVDEAHAVGVLGGGRGASAAVAVRPDLLVGTFGKAFGSYGAYVCSTAAVCELLRHRARSYVFSTALPEAVVAATLAALRLVDSEEGRARRAALAARCSELRGGAS